MKSIPKPENERRKQHSLLLAAFFLGGALVLLTTRLVTPPKETHHDPHEATTSHEDAALVRSLLNENLSERSFDFATIAEACSGKRVIPLEDLPSHRRVTAAITQALRETIAAMNQQDSPVRNLRRINEASTHFEDGILARINEISGLRCEIPPTRSGTRQRSGYPDLRITDTESGLVCYLDPKLVEQGSTESTLRTFYFEPKTETLKITDDAIHLLAGIEHDGNEGEWTFTGWRLVDLSTLRVRLKAEFQASNAELYQKSVLSLPESTR